MGPGVRPRVPVGGRCAGGSDPAGPGAPPGPADGSGGLDRPGTVLEGDAAQAALTEAGRRTTSRAELSRAPAFEQLSPELGELDETAFEQALGEDPDAALSLLAELAGATDARLREQARALAGRVAVRLARSGPARERGVGRLRRVALQPGLELDLDASLEGLLSPAPRSEDLRGTTWGRPSVALSLLVDRSGSVGGARLATAALAAAAVVLRAPGDASVLAFSDKVLVLRAQDDARPAEAVVDDLLRLRGHGLTDLAAALDAARVQLDRSRAVRRVCVLLSDGRATTGPDPVPAARRLDELLVVAPEDDAAEATELARAVGARLSLLRGPADVPRALAPLAD